MNSIHKRRRGEERGNEAEGIHARTKVQTPSWAHQSHLFLKILTFSTPRNATRLQTVLAVEITSPTRKQPRFQADWSLYTSYTQTQYLQRYGELPKGI